MITRLKTYDWSTTPLGPNTIWQQSLRTAVQILLSSRYAMWMAWGPELTMLYNNAYAPTLGIKHPWALGKPASAVWSEIWPDIGPRIETVLQTGEATYDEGLLLFLERSGFPEETYHTFSYSPLADDAGVICGMLCVVTEETERVIGTRRVDTLRAASTALGGTTTEADVWRALRPVLGMNRKDLPFTLTYLYGEEGNARLVSTSGVEAGHALAPECLKTAVNEPWPAAAMLANPIKHVVDLRGWQTRTELPMGDWNKAVERSAVVPIQQQGQERPAGFFVAGLNPYRGFDADYDGFVDLLSGQISAGLSNARAYEAERRRAEALAEIDRAKTTFFSNVSHELRTPLTLMLSPIEEMIAKRGGAKTDESEMLELVHRNGLRLQRLVNGLLDFSRIEAGRMQARFEPVDLAAYTAELASGFRAAMERAGLEFVIDCPALKEFVYVDCDMWEKVVLNLLSNAFKFTVAGRVRIALTGTDSGAELRVEDSGSGIPAEELPHIFERFHRVEGARGRTIEGTGIGLALVQELVKLHGGQICAESEPGRGSCFRVKVPWGRSHLPAEKVREANGKAGTERQAAPFVLEAMRWTVSAKEAQEQAGERTGETILFADDNADMREYVTRLLGERFHVVAVENGAEALEAALAKPPDLILSDVMMPRLDGFGLIDELRKRPQTRTIPVILLSARAGEESKVGGLSAGADDYLVKPFTAKELMARVTAHLSMRKRRDEAERKVRQSEATLQSFYDSSPFAMGIVDMEDGRISPVYGNRAAAAMFEFEAGKRFSNSKEVERTWFEKFNESRRQRAPVRFEYEQQRRILSGVATYLGNGHGSPARFSFMAEDVTEKRRAEENIRRSNDELRRANADLEQFAYSASHDLQEPLRQVAVYSQLIEKKFGSTLEPKAHDYLAYCVEGAQRMEMLIADLLAYSQAGRMTGEASEPVDLNAVIEMVEKNLATTIAETGAKIHVPALPKVCADAVPMMHLFQNLFSNALKYRGQRTPELEVLVEKQANRWRFGVKDNGIGIPDEFKTQIFGIFKRLHDRKSYPGTGIGLAICQKIVEGYGGRIWVESKVGAGSTFYFELPRERTK